MPAFYSIALLIAFYALVVAEILIPSGGLLALSAAVVAVTSIIIACTYSLSLGLTLTLIYLVTTPVLFALLVHLWPKTKIGRLMLNRDTLESDTTPPPPTTIDGTLLSQFVGKKGIAASNLLPSGQVKIEGHKADAVSTGLPIDAGSIIIATRVYSGKLHVRLANQEEVARFQTQSASREEMDKKQIPPSVETDSVDVPTTWPPEPPELLTNSASPSPSSPLEDVNFEDIDVDELMADEHNPNK